MTQTSDPVLTSLEQTARAIEATRRLVVLSHVNPDADAIGSCLGMTRGLCAMGKAAIAALSDPVPAYARFLPGADQIRSSLPADVDDVLCVDAAGIDRIGTLYSDNLPIFEQKPVINIDHHRTNPNYGNVNYVVADASSTSELVYRLLVQLGAPIDSGTADALLFGIVGDTGSFRNGATTPGSLRTAAELVALGGDVQRIAFQLFEAKTFAAARVWGLIISAIELDRDRRIVFGYLSQQMLRETGAAPDEVEGVVEYMRGIEEAEVVVLLKENEDGDIRVSMRSRPGVDVSIIAAAFNGGGHRQAAGCTLPGPAMAAREALTGAFDAANAR